MLQKSTGSYRRAGPVNRGGAAASDKAVVDLEEGRWFRTASAQGKVWGSDGVREWPKRLRVGGADKVWLFFFVCDQVRI
jgi:hypothetical protein